MSKIALIGNKDTVLGFKALGVSAFPVSNLNEAREALRKVSDDDYAAVFITEQLFLDLGTELKAINEKHLPVITVIPDNRRNLGLGMKHIKSQIERAVGVDTLFKEEGV